MQLSAIGRKDREISLDIMNDEYWERLVRGAENIPDNWNRKCEESMRKERQEVEKRYRIRIGQTELYCLRCGRSWGFGKHLCRDLYLEQFKEAKAKEKALKEGSNINVGDTHTRTEYIMASQRLSFRGKTGMDSIKDKRRGGRKWSKDVKFEIELLKSGA